MKHDIQRKTATMPVPKPKTAASTRSKKAVNTARRPDDEVNRAPSAWGRRLARLVGANFGVNMVSDRSKNEGAHGKTNVVIKCAKSPVPPIFISAEMLQRVDEVWGVFVTYGEGAQIWSCPADFVRRNAYFTRNPKIMPRAEITLRTMKRGGTLIGTVTQDEIDACHIP
ncbi:hypothetical protein EON80_00380 [bacterium]|nr:MAG: hypothetical protein EON80_00380 [bacterium]